MCVELEGGVGCTYFCCLQHIILQTSSSTGSSQQCGDTINITTSSTFETIIIVEGGVRTCFRCLFNGAVDSSTMWTFGNLQQPIGSDDSMVIDGVLTVFNPTLQKQSGCFNYSMVTLVADKLKKHW